jgi:hypothetical protein
MIRQACYPVLSPVQPMHPYFPKKVFSQETFFEYGFFSLLWQIFSDIARWHRHEIGWFEWYERARILLLLQSFSVGNADNPVLPAGSQVEFQLDFGIVMRIHDTYHLST